MCLSWWPTFFETFSGQLFAISGDSKHCLSPIIFFTIFFWCELKPHAKLQNPMKTPSWRKVTRAERRETENTVNNGHLVLFVVVVVSF
jgi:hypothetical protein